MRSIILASALLLLAVFPALANDACEGLSKAAKPWDQINLATECLGDESLTSEQRIEVLFGRAKAYARAGDPKMTVVDMNEVLRMDKSNYLAMTIRCSAYTNMGDAYRAMHDCDLAIATEPNEPDAYAIRSHLHRKMGAFQNAINDLNMTLGMDPSFVEGFVSKADLYREMHKYEKAVRSYNMALEKAPAPAAYHGRAITYFLLEKYDLSLADVDRLIEMDPGNPQLYADRALILLKLERRDDAREAVQKAREIDPAIEVPQMD